MEFTQWLDLFRNLLLSGVLLSAIVLIFKAGRASQKLDNVVDEAHGIREELHTFYESNAEDHAVISGELNDQRNHFGNRLTALESEVKTVCAKKTGGPP